MKRALLLAVLLAGCAPDIRPALTPKPAADLGLIGPVVPQVEREWWRAFGDPQLDRLVADALAGSPTLEAATARVRQAEGARAMASSQVDQARFDVLQKASVAQADWTGARGRMEAGKRQLENALRARDVYKNEYTLSKRSINDLLSVEQDVWAATSAKIMAEYDGWSAAINYASAVDNLMPLIGIEKNAAAKLPDLS